MKHAAFVFLIFLTKWLSSDGVEAAIARALQQCDCKGDPSFLGSTPKSGQTEIVLTAFFSFKDCNNPREAGSTTTYHLIPAALLAVEEINNSSDILGEFHVTLDIRDTQCDPALGIFQFIQSINDRAVGPPDNSLTLAILGPGCSAVTQAIAGVAGRGLNIPQVSYGYNLPVLTSKREKFPSFFQTARSIDLTTVSALRLLSHLGWTNNIGVIYETSDLFNLVIEMFVRLSSSTRSSVEFVNGETIIPITRFAQVTDDSDQGTIGAFINGIVRDEVRVIVGFVSNRIASLLMCMTRNVSVPSDGFLFVLVGPSNEQWWMNNEFCQLESNEVESVIVVSGESIVTDPSTPLPSQNGRTIHDFKVDYSSRLSSWCPLRYNSLDPLAAATYDAVWSIAKALDDNCDLLNVNNTDHYLYNSLIYKSILASLNVTNFTGVSGQVQFNEKGERLGIDVVLQMQNGVLTLAGKFKPDHDEIVADNFQWFGVTTSPPSDTPTVIDESVSYPILIISMVFTLTGMAFACSMCCFNWCYAKHKIIIASSQKLNYIIIAGTFFAYTTIVILAILESPLGQLMSDELFKTICVVRIWILPLSFTLSYGTMLAKAWRIYRIFNDPWVSKRPLKDYHLMLIVLGLGLVDVMYLIPWTIIDPYRRFQSLGETDYRAFSRCSFFSCSSEMLILWLGILTAYKVIVMLAGVAIISLVQKNVRQKKYYNDSKSLAGALYTTALSFILGVFLQLLFTFRQEIVLAYIASATWVSISSSGTLISVFIPKLYKICVKHEKGKKYQTVQSIFYRQHPEVLRPIGESVGSLSVGSLTNMNQTVMFDITTEDIATITGTDL